MIGFPPFQVSILMGAIYRHRLPSLEIKLLPLVASDWRFLNVRMPEDSMAKNRHLRCVDVNCWTSSLCFDDQADPATLLSWNLVPSGDNDFHRELTLEWK